MKLEKLHDEIWEHKIDRCARPPLHWSTERRALTAEELVAVFQGARDGVCEVHNACMGFGIGLVVYGLPQFPGLPLIHRVSITNKHISAKARFDDGWELFFPVVSTEENQRRMAHYGLEPLKGASHYDY